MTAARPLLALVLVFVGCNEFPVGSDQLDRIPYADSVTLLPDTIAGYSKYVALGAADQMYLGEDAEYRARVLVRFPLPDTAFDSAQSMQLVLQRADSVPMSFVVRPCSTNWKIDAASWLLADSVTHWLTPGGDYWDIDLGSGTFAEDSLVIDLDLAKLDEQSLAAVRQNGVLIFPGDTGFAAIQSGYSEAVAPRLRIDYPDDVQLVYNSVDDAHLVDTFELGRGAGFRIGSGMAFRTYLRFSFDSIPAAATIAEADLVFVPEVEYRRSDTLVIGVRRLLEPLSGSGRYARFGALPEAMLSYIVDPDSDSTAILDLRELVQFWTANPDSNFGLLLVAEPEYSLMFRLGVDRVGPAAPKLKLLYVMPPEDRFH